MLQMLHKSCIAPTELTVKYFHTILHDGRLKNYTIITCASVPNAEGGLMRGIRPGTFGMFAMRWLCCLHSVWLLRQTELSYQHVHGALSTTGHVCPSRS